MIGHVVLCALASAFGSDGAQAEEVTLAAPAPGAVGANACQLGVAPTSRVWAPVPAVGALTYAFSISWGCSDCTVLSGPHVGNVVPVCCQERENSDQLFVGLG